MSAASTIRYHVTNYSIIAFLYLVLCDTAGIVQFAQ